MTFHMSDILPAHPESAPTVVKSFSGDHNLLRVPPVTPEQAAAATAYVRRRCADADVILATLGLDVTA